MTSEIIKLANRVLGIIQRTYENKSKKNIVALDKSLVGPHLEFNVQSWRPYYQGNINELEKVQRRALRMIDGFKELLFEEKLRQTNLCQLK